MKTIKRRVLVAVFMLGTLVNYANSTNTPVNAKKVKVVFQGAKIGHELTVKDNNGVILHSENILKEGKLVKVFDFSKLENGNYTLELDKDFEIIIKSILVENKLVVFNEDSKKTIFKPIIRNENNKLMISKIAFDKEPLEINIYYNDEIIYTETVNGNTILNRVYRLDKEIQGSYKVIIYNNNRSYTNEFTL
jgi:hypothetical protein